MHVKQIFNASSTYSAFQSSMHASIKRQVIVNPRNIRRDSSEARRQAFVAAFSTNKRCDTYQCGVPIDNYCHWPSRIRRACSRSHVSSSYSRSANCWKARQVWGWNKYFSKSTTHCLSLVISSGSEGDKRRLLWLKLQRLLKLSRELLMMRTAPSRRCELCPQRNPSANQRLSEDL